MSDAFRVGHWLVQPSLNVISSNGRTVHLEPKVMEVLVCLADRAGEVLSRQALIRAIWKDTFVTDDALKRCISELRHAFSDDAHKPRFIETIPKRGYRLLAAVVRAVEEPSGDEPSAGKRERSKLGLHRPRTVAAVLCGAALALAALILWTPRSLHGWLNGTRSTATIHSLAVLPLENLSADRAQEYFSDGMTDTLITDLAQLKGVKVISRTSIMRYKHSNESLPEIARELHVDGVVEGTVQRFGQHVRISAQLVRGSTDKQLWADSYDRKLTDTLQLEEEVASDIAEEISASLASSAVLRSHPPYHLDVKAYDDYLKGRIRVRRFTREDVEHGVQLLKSSIQRDPNYAPAYAELSLAYQALAELNYSPPSEVLPKAKAAAKKALSLNANLAEAHCVLGLIYGEYEWDWPGQERELRRAVHLEPNFSLGHSAYAIHLATFGRKAEAIREINTALELDPFSPTQLSAASFVFLATDRYEQAAKEARRAVDIEPGSAVGHLALAASLEAEGDTADAFTQWLSYLKLDGDGELARELASASARLSDRRNPGRSLAQMTVRYYRKKSKTQYVAALTLAEAYVDMGDKDKTFEWLNKAYENHSTGLYTIVVDPSCDALRSDPRFQSLLARMNLSTNSPGS